MTEVATTSLGRLRGVRDNNAIAWLGVPYAKPPVGALRLRAPVPPDAWDGERAATAFGKCPPQVVTEMPVAEPMVKKLGVSEDCLYLNVWSPAADGAKRPVLFWIHGGAFMMGTGATYSGADLAALGDIVVVTINYRLGPLGFVGFSALGIEGVDDNLGLRDQLAALAWVRSHVGAFGGDPDRITIAGESAGSVGVGLLMMMERARGQFAGAIMQSGSISLAASRERAVQLASLYVDELGARDADALRALPAERFVAAHQKILMANLGTVTTRPYLDGDLLPATAAALFDRAAANVPLLCGSNRDEATLFALLKILPTERPQLEQLVRARLDAPRAEAILAQYEGDRAGSLHLARDAIFGMPTLHFAERHAPRAPTWLYRFDWPTPAFGGALGAMHALELFLIWMDPDKRGTQILLGGPPSAQVRALGARMKQHWIAFVRDGDPGGGWPRYDGAKRVAKVFDLDDALVEDLEGARRAAWHGIDGLED